MEVVELNVGGRVFVTTESTFCKDSNSMLATMFSGQMKPAHKDSQGRFFIDRDGDLFAKIMSYLRGEPLELPVSDVQRQALIAEARYYQLADMEEQVMRHQAQHTRMMNLDQADLQTEVSKLTYREGRMLLLEVAKATVGAEKVQQICDTLVKLFFFSGPNLFSGLSHDELGQDEHFQEIRVLTGNLPASMSIHLASCHIWLRVPGLQPEELCILLNEYEALFQAEMEMRGFSLSKDTDGFTYMGRDKIEQWLLAHE